MIAVGIAIALGLLLGVVAISKFSSDRAAAAAAAPDFDQARRMESDSVIGRALIAVSAPLAGLPYTNLNEESPGYRALRYKIASSGGLFGGSVTVFLSVQIAAGLVSAMALAVALFSGLGGLMLAGGVAFALAFAAWPYQRLTSTAKKRKEEVDRAMPEFAELLLMPLTSAYGILPALGFTADRVDSIVGREVKTMLAMINARTVSEEDAFAEAGARLGTASAISFFNTLSHAYTEGTRASDVIRDQAEQLRKISYENTRAKIKLLPTKLVVVIGVHLMPTLFVVTLLPVALQITQSMAGAR